MKIKIQLKSESDSVTFQKLMFLEGKEWADGQRVQFTTVEFLYVDSDNQLAYSNNTYMKGKPDKFFKDNENTEVWLLTSKQEMYLQDNVHRIFDNMHLSIIGIIHKGYYDINEKRRINNTLKRKGLL